MKYANMHLHSVHSDGILTPAELCRIVKELGYGAIVLSDHETANGTAETKKAAAEAGLDTMIGMELYAKGPDTDFHILAYDFDPTEKGIATAIEEMRQSMVTVTRARFEACCAEGIFRDITWQEVVARSPENAWLCNEHIFATLIAKGQNQQSDYWQWMQGFRTPRVSVKATYPKKTSAEVIRMIKNAGGVAVLAHPHHKTPYLSALYAEGLGGVECCHPDIDEHDEAVARQFAEAHRMYVTGGTDHTGLPGNSMERGDVPGRADGSYKGDILTPVDQDVRHGATREEFEALKNRIYG
ncbi:MAG: PHP domain-containing protein [Ruminococcaceae bacterium]|nr:PHP domain-containing protein [Oscillospiraceae bacterium]